VLHALIFDLLNFRSGHLDPSYAAITHKAGVYVRTVATALQRLRELGILHYVRRCAESWRDGRFVLEQQTNPHAVLPETGWRGYRSPQEPLGPAPGTWENPRAAHAIGAGPGGAGGAGGGRSAIGGADPRRRSQGPAGGGPGTARPGVHGARLVSFLGVQLVWRNLSNSRKT
jgi:hypothetical protein